MAAQIFKNDVNKYNYFTITYESSETFLFKRNEKELIHSVIDSSPFLFSNLEYSSVVSDDNK